jgi:hypothetical protein
MHDFMTGCGYFHSSFLFFFACYLHADYYRAIGRSVVVGGQLFLYLVRLAGSIQMSCLANQLQLVQHVGLECKMV